VDPAAGLRFLILRRGSSAVDSDEQAPKEGRPRSGVDPIDVFSHWPEAVGSRQDEINATEWVALALVQHLGDVRLNEPLGEAAIAICRDLNLQARVDCLKWHNDAARWNMHMAKRLGPRCSYEPATQRRIRRLSIAV